MFDRVKICPRCGNSDAWSMGSIPGPLDGFGCYLQIECLNCDHTLLRVTLDWILAHRLLRRLMIRGRTDHGLIRPDLWRPVPVDGYPGIHQAAALRKQVSEAWRNLCPRSHTHEDSAWKIAGLREFASLPGFVLETSGDTTRAITVRDYLSYQYSKGHDFCFG